VVTGRQAAAWNRAHPNGQESWKTCLASTVGVYVLFGYPRTAFLSLPGLLCEGLSEYIQTVDRLWEKQVIE
jgi:hypothetical protein